MSAAEGWIRERFSGRAPERLVETMLAALPEGERPVPDALAEAAVRLYGRVLAGDGTRGDALPLLAADALLTHAFEAQAELDPDGVAGLAERYGGGGRLAELVP